MSPKASNNDVYVKQLSENVITFNKIKFYNIFLSVFDRPPQAMVAAPPKKRSPTKKLNIFHPKEFEEKKYYLSLDPYKCTNIVTKALQEGDLRSLTGRRRPSQRAPKALPEGALEENLCRPLGDPWWGHYF